MMKTFTYSIITLFLVMISFPNQVILAAEDKPASEEEMLFMGTTPVIIIRCPGAGPAFNVNAQVAEVTFTEVCPGNTVPIFNGEYSPCSCPEGVEEVYNDDNELIGCECPEGMVAVLDEGGFISHCDCPEGQEYNDCTGMCEVISCPDGYFWNGYECFDYACTDLVESEQICTTCPTGYIRSDACGGCIPRPDACDDCATGTTCMEVEREIPGLIGSNIGLGQANVVGNPTNSTGLVCVPTGCYDGIVQLKSIDVFCGQDGAQGQVETCITLIGSPGNPLNEGEVVTLSGVVNCNTELAESILNAQNVTANGQLLGAPDPAFDEDYALGVANSLGEIEFCFYRDPGDESILNTSAGDISVITEFNNGCLSLGDPISCDNPDNKPGPNGFVAYFADEIQVRGNTPNQQLFLVVNTSNILDGSLNVIVEGTSIGFTNGDGDLDYQFFRAPGQEVDIQISGVATDTVGAPLTDGPAPDADTCPVIPTMNQWALFILGLMLTSLALVYVRRLQTSRN